ncbi:MAG: protein-methionine-sulfoxide reductase catalytic subunit MsrP [Candidatus Hydrogenedentales bacterium]
MPNIIRRPAWYLPDSAATPQSLYRDRRRFLKQLGFAGAAAAGLPLAAYAQEATTDAPDPEVPAPVKAHGPLPTFETNPTFKDAGRELTDQKWATQFNNFYEFGIQKSDPAANAQGFALDPYTLEIDGLVENPMKIDLEQIEKLGLEERVYRFRCVEAWSMTVPWVGVPLHKIIDIAKPTNDAKYVRFETFMDPNRVPGQRMRAYEWPYVEGLRIDEARNELTMAVVGLYGERLLPQSGTPLRIITPWKYGYKGPKSIVKMSFVDKEPSTFWNDAIPKEYKFYSNVDPKVPHPRWSQASEKLLGDVVKREPTQWYNGYGEYVAAMYADRKRELY